MASTIEELVSILSASEKPEANVRLLGENYAAHSPQLLEFARRIHQSTSLLDDWREIKRELKEGSGNLMGAQADARLMLLYSSYSDFARSFAGIDSDLPFGKVAWIGKGARRIPVENSVWFLLETDGIGSEGVRDVLNVLGGEITFQDHLLSHVSDAELLEQAGIFLAMLFHLRLKWPAYFQWMPMQQRLRRMVDLFLFGDESLPITYLKRRTPYVPMELVEVYDILSKTMYQVDFFVKLKTYARQLLDDDGKLGVDAEKIRKELLEI